MNKSNHPPQGGQKLAESVEQRGLTEGNASGVRATGTLNLELALSGLDRIREKARRDKRVGFTALLHHIDVALLRESYLNLNRSAAAGVDGVLWKDYQESLWENLSDLHARVHSGRYRALPSKRSRISKEDGSERKLGIASLEDKIVQQSVVSVLNAIYEQDFVGYSYGFRPGRNQHRALDALYIGLERKPINWVVDLDIQGYFDCIQHDWLLRFVEHRVGDKRIVRLIRKWLKAGVLEEEQWQQSDVGSPQGAVISPLLSNIYLHYVFDLWFKQRRERQMCGEAIVVRYADDIVAGYELKEEAENFLRELSERLEQFGLKMHPRKTRLLEFGRRAIANRKRAGEGKPETFDFLGFTHISAKDRRGRFAIRRHTIASRQRRKLKALKSELRKRSHRPVPETGRWLKQVLQGYYRYFAVPGNQMALNQFRYRLSCYWIKALRRRSQKARRGMTWEKFKPIQRYWLPYPRVLHPYPRERFGRLHPR